MREFHHTSSATVQANVWFSRVSIDTKVMLFTVTILSHLAKLTQQNQKLGVPCSNVERLSQSQSWWYCRSCRLQFSMKMWKCCRDKNLRNATILNFCKKIWHIIHCLVHFKCSSKSVLRLFESTSSADIHPLNSCPIYAHCHPPDRSVYNRRIWGERMGATEWDAGAAGTAYDCLWQ